MFVRCVLSLSLALAMTPAAQAATFVVTSPEFADDGQAPLAGAQPACGGTNTSPALAWTGAPPETKSFVILLVDADNWTLAGEAAHWIAYGIPSTVSQVPAGFGSQTPPPYVSGTNLGNQAGFRGYCPHKGDAPHHYVYAVFATNLAPDALPAGLTRAALTAALKGHTLAGSSIVARFAPAP